MANLTAARAIEQLGENTLPFLRKCPVAANAVIYHGAMVGRNGSGYWDNASTSLIALGVADLSGYDSVVRQGAASVLTETPGNKIDNTGGADGAIKMHVRQGVFKMGNKAGDLVTEASIGATVSVEDNQTVRATAAGSVAAGKLAGLSDDGSPLVLIEIQ